VSLGSTMATLFCCFAARTARMPSVRASSALALPSSPTSTTQPALRRPPTASFSDCPDFASKPSSLMARAINVPPAAFSTLSSRASFLGLVERTPTTKMSTGACWSETSESEMRMGTFCS
jgi:hypothetical protein